MILSHPVLGFGLVVEEEEEEEEEVRGKKIRNVFICCKSRRRKSRGCREARRALICCNGKLDLSHGHGGMALLVSGSHVKAI